MGRKSMKSRCTQCNKLVANVKKHLAWCIASTSQLDVPTLVQYQVSKHNVCLAEQKTTAVGSIPPCRPLRSNTNNITTLHNTNIPFPCDLASRLTTDTVIAKKFPEEGNDSEFYLDTIEQGAGYMYTSNLPDDNSLPNNSLNLYSTRNESVLSDGSNSTNNISHKSNGSISNVAILFEEADEESTTQLCNDKLFKQQLLIPPTSNLYYKELSPEFISVFRCYQILHKARVPLYVHDQIIHRIGKEIVSNKFDPFQTSMKRKAFLKELSNRFKTAKPLFSQFI
jgi:hypothetical protein